MTIQIKRNHSFLLGHIMICMMQEIKNKITIRILKITFTCSKFDNDLKNKCQMGKLNFCYKHTDHIIRKNKLSIDINRLIFKLKLLILILKIIRSSFFSSNNWLTFLEFFNRNLL